MSNTALIAARLHDMARRYNRELAFEVVGKAALGIVFSFVTFGMLFWFGWVVGFFFAHSFGLQVWQLAALVSGLFLIVATWSAWQRVDPLADLPRLSDQQLLLTLISQASPDLLYFSPRHATAGAALLLIEGPANVLKAFGIWGFRLRFDAPLIAEASHLLEACAVSCPIEEVREPSAALLLKRLALVKSIPQDDSVALTVTEKGATVLSRSRVRANKGSRTPGASKRKRS